VTQDLKFGIGGVRASRAALAGASLLNVSGSVFV
jgi:hypothetical protein